MKLSYTNPASVPGMYGVPLDDPRRGSEPLAAHIDAVCQAVMRLVQQHHHAGQVSGFEMKMCSIGPPRGKRSGIARIELIYQHEIHGWRHVFAVTESGEHGLRLWTEVRRYVRPS
ncbi:MAG: hypothetical protein E6P95_01110 [Candidatus Moraniibacteriota bacterium]|nr:MAG: hypothetical protein E6P95_01110 [Candidatus Moranbacteria bacterium]